MLHKGHRKWALRSVFDMESRSSSCCFALGDGPDFLDFAVNQVSVDDDSSEFMFPSWPEKQSGDCGGEDYDKTRYEFEQFEMETKSKDAAPLEENKDINEGQDTNTKLEITERNERRRRSDIQEALRRQFDRSLEAFKSDKQCLQPINAEKKTTKPQGMRQKASKSTATHRKRQPFMKSQGTKLDASYVRMKAVPMRRECWPLLRNPPHENERFSRQKSQKKLGIYDIATNFYELRKGQNKDLMLHPPKTETKAKANLSLAQRSGSNWLQKSLRSNKTQLQSIGSSRVRHYSEEWIPEKSVHYKGEVWNESSNFQSNASRQSASDSSAIVLKSVLHTLETTRLSDPNKKDLLKYSLPSLDRSKNQASFRRKALPFVKSVLAFKHNGNDKLV